MIAGLAPTLGLITHLLRRFRRDEQGAATLMTGMILVVSIGIAAICMDGGKYYYVRRIQQSASDLAALSAASNLAQAQTLAGTSSTLNGYGPSSLAGVELGTYSYDPTVSPSARFVASSTTPNAVRVTLQSRPPFLFGGVLNALTSSPGASQPTLTGFQVRTRAVAVNQDSLSFAIGSGLAQLNGGIENAVLGSLLGSQLSLSLMDWQALAAANVDLFSFASALNTQANLSAATFGSVAAATVTRSQALQAVSGAMTANGASGSAIAALAAIMSSGGLSTKAVPLAEIVNFGPFGGLAITAAKPLTAKVSALDLLSAILQVANGSSEVQSGLALGIPGIASAQMKLSIGERPASTSLITLGPVGTTLHTAQTRLVLNLQLVGSGLTPTVNLPLYIEVASGTAQLSAIQCANTAQQATLQVTPGIANGWIGNVSDSDLVNFGAPASVSPAVFVNLVGLAQVTGSAHAAISNLNPVAVSFSQADIANLTRKTTSTTDFAASLYASLLSNLNMNVSVLGASVGLNGLAPSVRQVLGNAATPVDQALNVVLGALGISLGNATTWTSGLSCGRSTLVN